LFLTRRAAVARSRWFVFHKPIPSLPARTLDPQTLSCDDIAVRTIVDLPEEQIRALDAYGKKHGISRAEAVRRAVAMFLPKRRHRKLDFQNHPAFGAWRDRDINAVEYQRKLRAEWDDHS
jgi:hypothetical protein